MTFRTPQEIEPTQTQHDVDPSVPKVRSRIGRRLGKLALTGLLAVGAGAFLQTSAGHEVADGFVEAGKVTVDAVAATPKSIAEAPGDFIDGISQFPDLVDDMDDTLTGQDDPITDKSNIAPENFYVPEAGLPGAIVDERES